MDAREIARLYALGSRPVLSDGPVARGKQGEVWRLHTADGDWAVKVLHGRPSEGDVRVPTALQEAAYQAGVPTPQVRRTTDGMMLADAGERLVRVQAWVDLLQPDDGLDPREVGRVVAELHRVSIPVDRAIDPWYHEPVGADRWDALVERLRAGGAPFAERLADLRGDLVQLDTWVEPPAVLQICHRDLWADNLRATTLGGLCIVDWEDCGPADPSGELACVVFEFARTRPERARALVEAYIAAGGPGRLACRRDLPMLIAQLGHLTERAAGRWLTSAQGSPDRAEAEASLLETLDDPHGPDLLDSLLEAVCGVPPAQRPVGPRVDDRMPPG